MAADPALGTAIKRARERKRWTQRQLADALGVNTKTVDNWENGRTSPRNSTGAIEAVLGIWLDGDAPEPETEWDRWERRVLSNPDIPESVRRRFVEDARQARDAYLAAARPPEPGRSGGRHRAGA